MYQSSLKWSMFLDSLDEEQQQVVVQSTIINSYDSGELVFKEGRLPFGVYSVVEGNVKIYKTGQEGKKQIFQICTPGDLFGFHPLLNNTHYPDSAQTLSNCSIRLIPATVFLDTLIKSHNASYTLLRSVSYEFDKFINQQLNMAQKSVQQRVAIMLLELSKIFSSDELKNPAIRLSRQDLADLSGTTKETVVRMLNSFKKDGIIDSDGRKTTIIDSHRLVKLT